MCLVIDILLLAAWILIKFYHTFTLWFRSGNHSAKSYPSGSSPSSPSPFLSPDPLNTKIVMEISYQADAVVSQELVGGFKRARANEDVSLLFEFQNLSVKLKNGRSILQGVSGSIRPVCFNPPLLLFLTSFCTLP